MFIVGLGFMNELASLSPRHGSGGLWRHELTRYDTIWATRTKELNRDEILWYRWIRVYPSLPMPMRRTPHLASPNALQGIPHTPGITATLRNGKLRTTILPLACTCLQFWLANFLALFCNNTKLNGDEKNEWAGDLDIENPNLHDYKYKMWII